MAQQVEVNVQIGGTRIKHFTSLTIHQSLHTHHTFDIVVPLEDLEDKNEFFFKNAHQALCGQMATISFTPKYKLVAADFRFLGVVTELALLNNSDTVNSYSIRGHSPTYLMEDGMQRRAFVGQTLDKIMGAVLNDYGSDSLPRSVAPKYAAAIDYKAQYDESNFDFLSRLAAEYGEWCYYDGQQLNIGKPGTAVYPFVVDGIQHFDMSIRLKPNKFSMYHYNYVKHRAFNSAHAPTGGLGTLGDFAYAQSQATFGNAAQLWPLKDVQFQGDLDEARQTLNATNATDLIDFQGSGENPNINVGVIVDVTGQKLIAPGKYKQEAFGKYRVTHVTHTVDEIGNYANSFNAVPESAQLPPRNPSVHSPVALPEIATVITNVDPLKLGRVKVQFHWPNQLAGKSSWVRVTFPYTGSSRGMLFIPEKDDQVLISYEANHVDFPVIVGSIYHKSTQNDYWFPDNEQKFIRTKGGNKIVFKEKQGKQEIFITNANNKGTNLHISFEGDGTITLETKGLIKMKAKNIEMKADKSITMKAPTIEATATNSVDVKGMSVNIKGRTTVDVKAPFVKINS
ncbi:MAG: type VI secretion system tip protein VgrG [Bacteroidetes bacterium]|nr:type VI secretion system tip protein VgrG [Fibrella sp.]